MRRERLLSAGVSARLLLLALAAVTFFLAVSGGVAATVSGATISALALAGLAAALAVYTTAQVGPVARHRLGARAQAAQRRYHSLVLASITMLYITLVGGVLVANAGALWDCLALPICLASSDLAWIAIAHRAVAALATLLIAILVVQTRQHYRAPALRQAAGWSIGLMLIQNAIGLAQVVLARDGRDALAIARPAHLAIGVAAWAALSILATLTLRLPFPKQADRESFAPDATLRAAPHATLKDYVSLTKPGVITLLIFTTLAAMLITPVGMPSLELIFWTLLGGWLMPAGAHALNCYFDRDIDERMGRTGRRPLPSNRIPAWHALALGLTLAAISLLIFVAFVNWAAALLSLAGFFYYVVIYTLWLKRSTMSNIVIGGGAGAFPPLVGWAAATGSLTLPSLFLFLIIFYWTPPHFWALALIRQKDYANAGVPMLPVVAGDEETRRQIVLYSVLMLMLTLLPTPMQMLGLPYLALAALLGAIFLAYAVRLWCRGTTQAAWSLYKFSLLYLFLLFAAMVVDRLVA